MDWSARTAIDRTPGKLAGVWCFKGTRVPVSALLDHLDQGSSIDEFLEWFPAVDRQQLHGVLTFAKISLEQPAPVS